MCCIYIILLPLKKQEFQSQLVSIRFFLACYVSTHSHINMNTCIQPFSQQLQWIGTKHFIITPKGWTIFSNATNKTASKNSRDKKQAKIRIKETNGLNHYSWEIHVGNWKFTTEKLTQFRCLNVRNFVFIFLHEHFSITLYFRIKKTHMRAHMSEKDLNKNVVKNYKSKMLWLQLQEEKKTFDGVRRLVLINVC